MIFGTVYNIYPNACSRLGRILVILNCFLAVFELFNPPPSLKFLPISLRAWISLYTM